MVEAPIRSVLTSSDVELLKRVFNSVCFATETGPMSSTGHHLARFLIFQFKRGNVQEHTLVASALWNLAEDCEDCRLQ